MDRNKLVWAKDIIWRRIDNEIVIIKDDGLSNHVLNSTAASIWEMCGSGCEVGDIVSGLCERYDVSVDDARADVEDTLARLVEAGLLERAGVEAQL